MKKFKDAIEDACYGAIISWDGYERNKKQLKDYAYTEIIEESRNSIERNVRFNGSDKIRQAISDYIDSYYPEYEEEEVFVVFQ